MPAYFYTSVEKIQNKYNTTRAIIDIDSETANDPFSFDSNNNKPKSSTPNNAYSFTPPPFSF